MPSSPLFVLDSRLWLRANALTCRCHVAPGTLPAPPAALIPPSTIHVSTMTYQSKSSSTRSTLAATSVSRAANLARVCASAALRRFLHGRANCTSNSASATGGRSTVVVLSTCDVFRPCATWHTMASPTRSAKHAHGLSCREAPLPPVGPAGLPAPFRSAAERLESFELGHSFTAARTLE